MTGTSVHLPGGSPPVSPRHLAEIPTPAVIVDADALKRNLATMADALPGQRLRPHVKAHKCTGLARRQAAAGHLTFTCATIRECEGMAAAGLGDDLLLANEVLDARRLGNLTGARVTVAVDSAETIEAAVAGGVREVVIDVYVGLRRCGCQAQDAGSLADLARSRGLEVRGVMGYEGHVVGIEDDRERVTRCRDAMEILVAAHADVGGEIRTAGGTGTYAVNTWATEIQAGSYALMDAAYGKLGLPFEQAAHVLATVVSSSPGWAVADAGLKALSTDKGKPVLEGHDVWFCSDEHTTFAPSMPAGERIKLVPGHIDPMMACHERIYLVSGTDVVDIWPIDLRGWLLSAEERLVAHAGPAGTGKTRVLAAAAEAWGGPVFGTATSQNAANELRKAGIRVAANSTRLPADFGRIPPGSLIVVDEGSMASLTHLAAVVGYAARNRCKLVLAGDQERLAAVEGGGAMMLLADRLGYVQLAGAGRVRPARADPRRPA